MRTIFLFLLIAFLSSPSLSFTQNDQGYAESHRKTTAAASPEQVTQVMDQGISFLSGLMQMAMGRALQAEEGAIANPDTGEGTMKFKLPGFGG